MHAAIAPIALILGIWGGTAMAADRSTNDYLLRDYLLESAKSEERIVSWAKEKAGSGHIERFDYVRTERFDIGGKGLLVLLAARPMATQRIEIFVYMDGQRQDGRHEWSLLLFRRTNTADVKVEADKDAKRIVFRSKAGKTLLILPIENVDLSVDRREQ